MDASACAPVGVGVAGATVVGGTDVGIALAVGPAAVPLEAGGAVVAGGGELAVGVSVGVAAVGVLVPVGRTV